MHLLRRPAQHDHPSAGAIASSRASSRLVQPFGMLRDHRIDNRSVRSAASSTRFARDMAPAVARPARRYRCRKAWRRRIPVLACGSAFHDRGW